MSQSGFEGESMSKLVEQLEQWEPLSRFSGRAMMLEAAARIREIEAERDNATRMRDLYLADCDEAYRQRNHLVAALARLFPSGIRRTDIPGWDPEWHGCTFIDLPSGQISYHYHDSEMHLFEGLPAYGKIWDGHDKEVVHARLALLAKDATS
jgi:hypothetical protein